MNMNLDFEDVSKFGKLLKSDDKCKNESLKTPRVTTRELHKSFTRAPHESITTRELHNH